VESSKNVSFLFDITFFFKVINSKLNNKHNLWSFLWKIQLTCINQENRNLFNFINRKKYNSFSDEELLLLYKKEQVNSCIEIFYIRYGHLLLAIAFKYLKNKEDAEDVVMNLFENLGNKLVKHEIQNFKSWLHTTIKNECLMQLRKSKRISSSVAIEQLETASSEIDSEDFHIAREKIINELEIILTGLKSDQQKCIQLFFLENKSYVEIAEILNLSLNAVKSAIQNGKRMLKVKLENNGFKLNEI